MVKRIVDIVLLLLITGFGACFIVPDLSPMIETRVCLPVRSLLTGLTSGVSLPIFEVLALSMPIILTVMLVRGYISGITTVAKLLLAAYIITLGVPARQPSTLDEPREYTIEEYEEAARIICDRISRFSPPEIYSPSLAVSAAMDYANGTLGVDMTEAPRVKRTAAPALLTEMGIVAYYAFPTSEIVINTSAPDFMAVLSSAHEAMHLSGLTREDEANFFAVLALISSGDQALSFCAHLCAFVYVGAHICVQNRDTYSEIYDRLPDFVKEMLKKRTQFLQGKGSITGPVSDALNDAAISLRDSRGADSYSQSAALLVSYFLE